MDNTTSKIPAYGIDENQFLIQDRFDSPEMFEIVDNSSLSSNSHDEDIFRLGTASTSSHSSTSNLQQILEPKCKLTEDDEEVWYLSETESSTIKNVSHGNNYHNSYESNLIIAPNKRKQASLFEDEVEENQAVSNFLLSVLRPTRYAEIRRERRRLLKIPSVPKHDSRRLYLTMFANAVNSQSIDLLFGFVSTFCAQDLHFQKMCGKIPSPTCVASSDESSDEENNKASKAIKQLINRDMQIADLFAFFAMKYDLHVDHCFAFHSMRVITKQASEEVRLEADVHVQHTDIYDTPPELIQELFATKRQLFDKLQKKHDHHRTGSYRDQNVNDGKVNAFQLSRNPQQFALDGKIVFTIAPNRMINHIQMFPVQHTYKPVVFAS